MRRWLSILLLALLPFQFSWAALATYCEHETGTQARHLGHHEHEHEQQAQQRDVGADDEAPSPASGGASFDVGECHCHCPGVAALPTFPDASTLTMSTMPSALADAHGLAPTSPRPERPQWMGHA